MRQCHKGSCRVFQALTPLPASQNNELSIVSFNILTRFFEQKHYYQYVNALHRQWSYRYPKIKEIITNYCSDIICLQECDPFSFGAEFGEFYKQEFNYEYIIDLKDTTKQKYKEDSNASALLIKPATLYKMDKFKLIYNEFRSRGVISLFQLIPTQQTEHKQQEQAQEQEQDNESESKQQSEQKSPKQKRKSNKKSKGKPSLDEESQYVFIVNVHLEGEPKKWATRWKQIKSILDRITFRCQEYHMNVNKIPIIICGDFNDGMKSSIHKTLIEGGLAKSYYDPRFGEAYKRNEKDAKSDYQHAFDFNDSYQVVFENSLQLRPPTFAGNAVIGIVDFIYYTQNNLQCLGVSQPFPVWMMNDEFLLLPNENWVSDHLPIAGLYQITSEESVFDEKKKKQKQKKMTSKEMRKNARQETNGTESESVRNDENAWRWHEINSF